MTIYLLETHHRSESSHGSKLITTSTTTTIWTMVTICCNIGTRSVYHTAPSHRSVIVTITIVILYYGAWHSRS